jgi:transcription elongation factor GreA
MVEKFYPVSEESYKEQLARLRFCEVQRRTEIAADIERAREFGDLSENAEYKAAKDDYSKNEQEIVDIQARLEKLQILKPEDIDTSVVGIGTKVLTTDMQTKIQTEYKIVTTYEVNPQFPEKISDESPKGRILLGKKVGEIARLQLANGMKKEFKIEKISK